MLDRSGRAVVKDLQAQVIHDLEVAELCIKAFSNPDVRMNSIARYVTSGMAWYEKLVGIECSVIRRSEMHHVVLVSHAEIVLSTPNGMTVRETSTWLPAMVLEAPGSSDKDAIGLSSIELCESMLDNPQFADVTFKLGDGEVQAHRCVLVAASPAFAGMFASPMLESRSGMIQLPDCKQQTIRTLLRMLYTGHVDPKDWSASSSGKGEDSNVMPLSLLLDVVKVAKKYMIDNIMRAIIAALKRRLADAAQKPEVIETILAEAVLMDIGALRIAAVKAAESSKPLRKLYDDKNLRPEVQDELQAIWPIESTSGPKKKRMRVE